MIEHSKKDYLEEETPDERRFRRSAKMQTAVMMILMFLLGAMSYRTCSKFFHW